MTTAQPSLLVIRHEECSSLGLLKTAVKDRSIPIRYLDTPKGEVLSEAIANYSHIVVLGGVISAYEDETYPFLQYEFELLESAIAQKIPILGICLGSQILAKVLGAKVYRGESGREAGWCEIQLLETAKTDPLFKDFPPQFRVFQSHQDTFDIPPNCDRLAQSSKYPNQAFRYQDHVWAIQFHLEIDENVLSDCSTVIAQELVDSQIQDTTIEQMLREAEQYSPAVKPLADSLMEHFLAI
ncbi:MAG: type 1 glutamine amidotransferase [Drouetiella hepatica Uher 2000/2452]|jgi:GMP synthase-like glutamine amidotransferase|uniref:Type 1 glutamine amidotransferase n=1 Tax=Drouetiella hepatica Uher 2000/2452 TaxID=904376 RepID=A0A951UQ37_9CYAN|nr:type 1 glutamine amidotransferase [Drouetiella hepatica Uher 2000/2452]